MEIERHALTFLLSYMLPGLNVIFIFYLNISLLIEKNDNSFESMKKVNG